MKLLVVVASALLASALGVRYPPAAFNWTLLSDDEWWGPAGPGGAGAAPDTGVRPARVVFGDEMVKDLKQRLLRRTAFAPPLSDVGFEYGFNGDAIGPWLSYWANNYNFKEREAYLNQYPQFTTNIQGIDMHFIWIKPEAPASKTRVPLLMLHGFVGSMREFYEALPQLAAVREGRPFVLDLVVPCLPGYGYSGSAARPGLGAVQMGVVLRNLMRRLGYDRFYVQGGDWGGWIASRMATIFSQEVLGYHTNWAFVQSAGALALQVAGALAPALVVEPQYAERMYPLGAVASWLLQESGFIHTQATKPDTVAIALTDSPAGLLAYILEKWSTHADPANRRRKDGGLWDTFTPEQLLDNLMLYWAPRSIASALRLYAESINSKQFALGVTGIPTPVPTAALQPRYEITFQSTTILRTKYTNLLNHTVLDYGGHFFNQEHPAVFADHVLASVQQFIHWHEDNDIGY